MATVLGTDEETMQSSLQQRLKELFRETERVRADLLADRITVKQSRAKQRELGKRLKALERELR